MNLEKGEKVLLASYHPLETCMFYFVFWFLASPQPMDFLGQG